MEEDRSVSKILTDKPTRKRPFGRPRRRGEENTRNDQRNRFQYKDFLRT